MTHNTDTFLNTIYHLPADEFLKTSVEHVLTMREILDKADDPGKVAILQAIAAAFVRASQAVEVNDNRLRVAYRRIDMAMADIDHIIHNLDH